MKNRFYTVRLNNEKEEETGGMDEYQLKNFLKFVPVRLGLVPRKRLFVHIPKNGGMAIRHAAELQRCLIIANRRRLVSKNYADGLKEHMSKKGATPAYEHARYRDIDVCVRQACRAFAIVRNPWSRTVSRFKFALQTRNNGAGKADYNKSTFERFLAERYSFGTEPYYWHRAIRSWYPQRDYVVDENERIVPDILRQEYLGDELGRYLGLKSSLKRRNISTGAQTDYREIYTRETLQIVADWYAVDIELFGFDFDTPATRNLFFAG